MPSEMLVMQFQPESNRMNIIRYETPSCSLPPFARFPSVSGEMNRLLDFPFFGRLNRVGTAGWVPPVDLHEDTEKLTVRAELPGLKKDQIQITLKEGVLTVAGERNPESNTPKGAQIRRERAFGKFERTIKMPFPVNEAGIKAAHEDGILTITVPKAEEAKPRQIAIN